jgi:hypothetical protein
MRKVVLSIFALLLVLGFALNASAEVNGKPEITKFMKDYYAAFQNARFPDEPGKPTVYDVRDFFSEDCKLFVHPNFQYDDNLDESPFYAADPPCEKDGVSCGSEEILEEVIKPFVGWFPTMWHDVKQQIFWPEGKNVWKVWLFYDYKYPGNPAPPYFVNFPGVSIYTVDLSQRRQDGGRGRVTEGRLIYDNYKFLHQIGVIP